MVIEINYLEDLDDLRNDNSSTAILMRDLDFNDDDSYLDPATNKSTWTTGAGFPPIPALNYDFDGQGHVIYNLYMNTTEDGAALFKTLKYRSSGFSTYPADLIDLGLKNINVSNTGANTGVLTGNNQYGKIRRCFILDGTFTGGDNSGLFASNMGSYYSGFGGRDYGDIYDCITNISASVGANSGQLMGNAKSNGTVNRCIYLGNGGELIGSSHSISNCLYNSDINTSSTGIGKTSTELEQLSTYTNLGYNMVLAENHSDETWFLGNRARLYSEPLPYPKIADYPPDNITKRSVRLYAEIIDIDLASGPGRYKFQYRKVGDTAWLETSQVSVSEDGLYQYDIDGLDQETEYEYRALIVMGDE